MAVTATPLLGKVQLIVEKQDDQGKLVERTKSFSGIESAAADADVYAVANTLGSLQQNTVNGIVRVDVKELEDIA